MAADQGLIQGAYRAAMANVPKDLQKIFMQEARSITSSVNKGLTAFAKAKSKVPKLDQRYERAMENFSGIDVNEASAKVIEEQAQKFQTNYNASDNKPLIRAKIANAAVEGNEWGKDWATLMSKTDGTRMNPEMEKLVGRDMSVSFVNDKLHINFAESEYTDNNENVIKEPAKSIPYNKLKNMYSFDNKGDADVVESIKSGIINNAQRGGIYKVGAVEREVTDKLLNTPLNIYHFAKENNFVNKDGTQTSFSEILKNNPEVQDAVVGVIEDDPRFKSFDVVGNDKKVTQEDLNAMLDDMKTNQMQGQLDNLIKSIINPEDVNYNQKTSQAIIAKTLVASLQPSHNEGKSIYDAVVNANTPKATAVERKQSTLVTEMSQSKDDLPGEYVIGGSRYEKKIVNAALVEELELTAEQIIAIGEVLYVGEFSESDGGGKIYATPYDMIGKLGPNQYRKNWKGLSTGSAAGIGGGNKKSGGKTIADKIGDWWNN